MAGIEFKPTQGLKAPTGNDTSNAEETLKVPASESINVKEDDEDEGFTFERSVTISLVKDYSLYRRVNDKALAKRVDYIGSSIQSSRTLTANKGEVEAYFPNIIGLAPNNENFITRVKQYVNNIMIKVDELGKTFNTSFHFNKKSDYYAFKSQLEKIEADYNRVNRSNLVELRKALNLKIDRINTLESNLYKKGYPINVEDYLMYRHCLLYRSIAKDMAFINSDTNIRFYFKDDVKEAEKAAKQRKEINLAKANYVTCLSNPEMFEAVYIQYCLHNNLPVMPSLADNSINKETNLDRFSSNEPELFNKIFNDKDIIIKALIEKLIARGELIRMEHTQNITTPTGNLIGANLREAIVWFKDVNNTSAVNAYRSKLLTY